MTDPVDATAPFDHPRADIFLRSSDNVDFRVFKLFLSLASPFFQTLFEIPEPAEPNREQEFRGGLGVIPVSEDSKTLNTLLRLCYPCTLVDDPKLEVLNDAIEVLEAARKYDLEAIEKKVRQAIVNPKFLEVEPWRCFAIARRGCLREEMQLAAKYTLTHPRIPPWFEEIGLISVSDLLALLTYHQKCGEAVYALRSRRSWEKYQVYNNCFRQLVGKRHCVCLQRRVTVYPQWCEDLIKETFTALRDKPCRATVQAIVEQTVQAVKALNCEACSPIVFEGTRDFLNLLTPEVEEVVSQVELQLEFE